MSTNVYLGSLFKNNNEENNDNNTPYDFDDININVLKYNLEKRGSGFNKIEAEEAIKQNDLFPDDSFVKSFILDKINTVLLGNNLSEKFMLYYIMSNAKNFSNGVTDSKDFDDTIKKFSNIFINA